MPSSSIRVRLMFDDCTPCRAGSVGRRKCWFLLNVDACRRITDVEYCIRETFRLGKSSEIELLIDDFVLPPFENSDIIRENDLLRVKLLSGKSRYQRQSDHDQCDDGAATDLPGSKRKKKKASLTDPSEMENGADDVDSQALLRKSEKRAVKRAKTAKAKESKSDARKTTVEQRPLKPSQGSRATKANKLIPKNDTSQKKSSAAGERAIRKLVHGPSTSPMPNSRQECRRRAKMKHQSKGDSSSPSSGASSSDTEEESDSQKHEAKAQSNVASRTEINTTTKSSKNIAVKTKKRMCSTGAKGNVLMKQKATSDANKGVSSDSGSSVDSGASTESSSTEDGVVRDRAMSVKSVSKNATTKTLPGLSTKSVNLATNMKSNGDKVLYSRRKGVNGRSASSSSSSSSSSDSNDEITSNLQTETASPVQGIVTTSVDVRQPEGNGPVGKPPAKRARVKTSVLKSSDKHLRFSSDTESEVSAGEEVVLEVESMPERGSLQEACIQQPEMQTAVPKPNCLGSTPGIDKINETDRVQAKLLTLAGQPVIPKAKDYGSFPPLIGAPRPGDIVAYKILELSESYTPEVSGYKEGEVITFNHSTSTIEMSLSQLSASLEPNREGGKFELEETDCDGMASSDIASRHVLVTLPSLIEPKLIS